MNYTLLLVLLLVLAKWTMQVVLEQLNRRYLLANAERVSTQFEHFLDKCSLARSVQYTLAKSRLGDLETACNTIVLLLVLLSGFLPWSYDWFSRQFGQSACAGASYLFAMGVLLALPGLPLAWYAQFSIEERFGFNRTTPKLWCLDRLKALMLAVLLGYPLLVLILDLVRWSGNRWWLWAWACMTGFQILMLVLTPMLILPWFNRFTPLAAGPLRERLLALARRAEFPAKYLQVMDGSKRSTHSNAFLAGFGRFRRIVLFDTLLEQLGELGVAAVLAHEIGHWKRRHVLKMLIGSAGGLLGGLGAVAWLANQAWFCAAFGFQSAHIVTALLVCALLSGTVAFWFSPLTNRWSRRYEYQADAYAVQMMGQSQPLVQALRVLEQKNLSNLTPHPSYSAFYYSHPTLLEREAALRGLVSLQAPN